MKFIFFIFFVAISATAFAEIGISGGPGSTGISWKKNFFKFELRGDFSPEVQIGTIKGSCRMKKFLFFTPYIGYGVGKISFDVANIKGTGNIKNIFLGTEICLPKNIFFCVDCNYATLRLKNEKDAIKKRKIFFDWGIGINF